MSQQHLRIDDQIITAPVDVNAITPGDVMTFTYKARITGKSGSGNHVCLSAVNLENNAPFEIRGTDLVKAGLSADYYAEEVTASLTKVAEIFAGSKNVPFTVTFEKQNGEIRKLRGWMLHASNSLGQSRVLDLDLPPEDRQRTVEHKKIKSLIVEGTKYVVA